jgi:hypothetical protein
MTQPTKAIISSSLGILSLVGSTIFAMLPSGLNVHSGEVFIYLFLLLIGFMGAPTFFFIKAVTIVKPFQKSEQQSSVQKLAIVVTAVLGLALGVVVLGFVWTMVAHR